MKNLFGKKVAVLFLAMNLLLSFLVVNAETNVGFIDCNILEKRISDESFQEVVQLKTVNPDGIEKTYSFASKVRINGSNYRNVQDIYDAVEENSFAKMAVEDGVITVLNFGSSSENYENVQYKEKKRCFHTLNSKQSNLPIYYRYNGDFVPPHLDENHYYDIDVYDYAICINQMKSKTENAVIDYIDIGSKIGGDFTQSINIYCESKTQDGSILKGELYDESNRLIREVEGEHGELSFGGLENESKAYVIKLWLEDSEGNEISCKYIKEYKLDKVEVKNTFVSRKRIGISAFGEVAMIKAVDADGTEKTYNFAEKVRINGSNYRNAQDIYDAVEENSFAKMTVENGVITVLNFGSSSENYENAEYDSEAKAFIAEGAELQSLPVYYRYNGDFVPPHLDENHYYDIEVYDYAICINQMKSKAEKTVIDYIDIGSKIGGDFTQSINVYCESKAQDSSILKGELYDESNRLICQGEGVNGELSFGGLENETKAYVIKLWLEDGEGNEKSSKYIKEYTVSKGEVK
ncbi:MAG: hypothetical protein IJA16_04780, partial [Clostridia bacterium]|nr:hypothetical protein [Clostridia bacterium]